MTIGIVDVAFLAARVDGGPEVTITSIFRRTSSAARSEKPIRLPFRESRLNDDVFSLSVAKITKTLAECLVAVSNEGSGDCGHITYPRDFLRLLRLNRNARRKEHSAKRKGNDLFHRFCSYLLLNAFCTLLAVI